MSNKNKPVRVAFLGGRGIPPTYGGYCTLFDHVGVALANNPDFEMTIYCRRGYFKDRPKWYKGIRLHYLPVWRNKYFESLLFTGMSVIHSLLFRRFDVIYVVDNANGPLLLPFWLLGKPTSLQTDGLGWKRRKWGRLARKYYKWSEKVSAALTTELVSDAIAIQDYYKENYNTSSVFIPYGAGVGDKSDDACLKKFGLKRKEFFLIVTRLEPDNNTDVIIREYKAAELNYPLIIVGGARYPSEFSSAIEAEAGDKVRFIGAIYESAILNSLYENAYVYLHGHVVGGTNPSLLRAMNAASCCVSIDVNFTREVLGEQGLFSSVEKGELASILSHIEKHPKEAAARGKALGERATECYRWDAVTDAYSTLFKQLARREARTEVYRPKHFFAKSNSDITAE